MLLGSCLLFAAIAKDITNDLDLLNIHGMSEMSCAKLEKEFCNFVQFFSDAKELVTDFNELFEYISFVKVK